jgi:hypothetical protein
VRTSVLIIQAERHIALGMIHPISRARKEIQKLGWDVTIRDERDGLPIDKYDYYVIQKSSLGNSNMVNKLLGRGNVILYDDAACFVADTLVTLSNDEKVPIADLVGEEEFEVKSNSNGKGVIGIATNCRLVYDKAPILVVVFESGEEYKCTYDQKFLLSTNQYESAIELRPGDLVSSEYGSNRVLSTYVASPADVYDFSVREYHNFALGNGAYVHNSTGTHAMKYLTRSGCVGYVKKQLLKDRSLYKTTYPRHRWHYYNLTKFNPQLDKVTEPAEWATDKLLNKVQMGWNLGLMTRNGLVVGNNPDYDAERPTDIHCIIKTKSNQKSRDLIKMAAREKYKNSKPTQEYWYGHYTWHRVMCQEKLADITRRHKFSVQMGRAPKVLYLEKLRKSKICVSPLGLGEICFRDFEAITSGALLVKPNMDHLETWPNIYIPGVTYVDVKWDWSDLEEKLKHILKNWDSYRDMRVKAFEVLKEGWSNKLFASRFDSVMRKVIEVK